MKNSKTTFLALALLTVGVIVSSSFISNSTTANAANQANIPTEAKEVAVANEKTIPVKLSEIKNLNFDDKISVYGKVEAKQVAMVPVRVPGIIQELLVDEGDRVIQNETILFKSDNLKLEQAVANAKQALKVLQVSDQERLAMVKIQEVDLDKQQKSFKRYKALFAKKAISRERYDTYHADLLKSQAELKQKKAFLELGRQQAKQALIQLKMAQKDLDDSVVKAPINGVISEKLMELGEMGQPGKPVFKIENTDILDVSAFVPAELISRIIPGETEARVIVNGKQWNGNLKVTYMSPTVDSKMHTFEIKCRVPKKEIKLYPGQSVTVEILLNSKKGVGIPTAALIKRNNGWIVFTIADGRAKEVPVKIGLEDGKWTQLINPSLKTGDSIVSMGQFLLKDNTKVLIQN